MDKTSIGLRKLRLEADMLRFIVFTLPFGDFPTIAIQKRKRQVMIRRQAAIHPKLHDRSRKPIKY